MFTGIVQAQGRIAASEPNGDGVRIRIDPGTLDVADVLVGDSIAVGGCCLTVVALDAAWLAFDVSAETLRCTVGFEPGKAVNLEKSLRLADRLGGHLMSGHVDGIGTIAAFEPVDSEANGSWRLAVDVPPALSRYIAAKGSIAVDGVSLTTNLVEGTRFTVNLIPHTLAVTTLAKLTAGATVNLEVDLIARYVDRLRAVDAEEDPPG